MARKEKHSIDIKINTIRMYLLGKKGIKEILYELSINKQTFYSWVAKYKAYGEEAFLSNSKNRYYPSELKIQAISDYLMGMGSYADITVKYKISNKALLKAWVKKYNNGHESTEYQNRTGVKTMTKGRKTTYEERIEIVSYCIANNYNYRVVAEKFQISYQQAYTWAKKYNNAGPEALTDKRGKRKRIEEISEAEKLAAQVRLLEAENKRLQLENGFLKKLREVERRRIGK